MTNAMPSLQMTIKLSYGWRALNPPCAAGRLAALACHWHAIHYRSEFKPPAITKEPPRLGQLFCFGAREET